MKVKSVAELDKINYGKDGDAAVDLRASGNWIVDLDQGGKELTSDEYFLQPGERVLIKSGIHVAIPPGCYGHISGRSGLSMKHGLQPLGGIIDETYRGEVGIVLVNLSKKAYKLTKNERVAQMVIKPYTKVNVEYVNNLEESNRGGSGFGDSGKF